MSAHRDVREYYLAAFSVLFLLVGLAVSVTASAAIAYVQGTSANSNSSGLLSKAFASAQVAGDLNVVIVSWNDGVSTVASVTDSKGNTYVAAFAPTVDPGTASEQIYYAKNISSATAGSNTVTVTYSTTVPYPEIRILEYSGIDTVNPFDVGVGAYGTGATQNTGSVTTTSANEVLVASNDLSGGSTAAGTGYTQRFVTPVNELVEDKIVTTTGTYNATSTQSGTSWWVIQMAAFRAATGDTTPPTAPTGLTATVASSTQINLSWTASTDNVGVTGYRVERCSGASCTTFAQIGTPTGTTYNDTGLTASTSYSYRVRASDAAGNLSGYSSTASGTTLAGGDTTPPTAPTGLGATMVSSTQINLSWTASTDNVGVTGYRVERCSGASCTTFAQIGTPTVTTYSDTGLTASTSYSYRVRATDAAGNLSGYSSTASGTTQATPQAPTAPGSLSAIPVSSTQINLAWTASTDPVGVTGYLIERCTGAGCASFAQMSSVAGTITGYSNTGLTSATSYSYRVRATDAAGLFSGYSPVASVTAPTGSGVSGSVTYGYDALGRLEQVASSTLGSVQAISYDAAGNIAATVSGPITTLSIENLSVSQAAPGQQITIDGSGFSTTLSSDAVTINGVAATIVSATATQLVVTVPSGATSGLVKVTVSGVAVTGTQALAIVPSRGAPSVTSFSPSGGPPGTTITITGTNFSTTAANNKVLINGTPAAVTAATATTLTVAVPPDVASGPIQVVTPSGLATSATNLLVPPSGYALTDIVATGSGTENGGAITLNASVANKPVLAFFKGTEGDQWIKVVVLGPVANAVQVLDPHGFPVATWAAPGSFIVPKLDVTGIYTVVDAPGSAGTVTMYVTTPLMASANLTWGSETAPTPSIYYNDSSVNPAYTQREFLTFSGAINQLTEVDVFNVSGTWTLSLVNSAGTPLWTSSSFSGTTALTLPPLPEDNSYTLAFDPGMGGGSFNYNAGIVASSSIALGSTVTVSGGGPNNIGSGPTARVAFSGTAGEELTLSIGATRGFFYGLNIYYLQGNSQVCLYTCGTGGSGGSDDTSYISLPVTGTYIIYLYFASAYPSAANLRLSPTIPLTIGASASSVSFGASASTGLYTSVITFNAGNQGVTFHDDCNPNWALLNSNGTVVNTYTYGGTPPTGSWSLGTLTSGFYSLVTEPAYGPSNVAVGSNAKTYEGNSSGSWPTTTTTCTLQLTSP